MSIGSGPSITSPSSLQGGWWKKTRCSPFDPSKKPFRNVLFSAAAGASSPCPASAVLGEQLDLLDHPLAALRAGHGVLFSCGAFCARRFRGGGAVAFPPGAAAALRAARPLACGGDLGAGRPRRGAVPSRRGDRAHKTLNLPKRRAGLP